MTASATLREQVALAFRRLQASVMGPAAAAQAAAAAAQADIFTLRTVPPEAFPLFLSASRWLKLLDGTLAEPHFFERCVVLLTTWQRRTVAVA